MLNPQDLIPFIDYTNLSNDLDDKTLIAHCQQACHPAHPVAAICVQPQYVRFCREILGASPVKIATVFNFPDGDQDLSTIEKDLQQALQDGADEFDVVIPLQRLETTQEFVSSIRLLVPNHLLKIIIATDVLIHPERIRAACEAVIAGGGDFIKTCTGKHNKGVSLDAVNIIIDAINSSGKNIGIKVSGGIKSVDYALNLYELVQKKPRSSALTPCYFRIGASQLLQLILTS